MTVDTTKIEPASPWDQGHSIEVLRQVAAGIVATAEHYQATSIDAGGIPAEWVIADGVANDAPVALYFHGGAYLCGTLDQYRNATAGLSRSAKVRVLCVDYRLAPEHPHPAAFEDAMQAYRWLLDQPSIRASRVLVAGDSAGASLAVSVAMSALEQNLEAPSCIVANSPFADFTLSSPSLNDPELNRNEPNKATIEWLTRTYLEAGKKFDQGPVSPRNKHLSPVYRDLSHLPALLVQTGGLDNLKHDGERLANQARAFGVITRHTEYPTSGHIWIVLQLPEADPAVAAAFEEIAEFCARYLEY